MAISSAVRSAEGPRVRNRSRGRSFDGQSLIFNEMVRHPQLNIGTGQNNGARHQRIVTNTRTGAVKRAGRLVR